jgi:hypothetical protein
MHPVGVPPPRDDCPSSVMNDYQGPSETRTKAQTSESLEAVRQRVYRVMVPTAGEREARARARNLKERLQANREHLLALDNALYRGFNEDGVVNVSARETLGAASARASSVHGAISESPVRSCRVCGIVIPIVVDSSCLLVFDLGSLLPQKP